MPGSDRFFRFLITVLIESCWLVFNEFAISNSLLVIIHSMQRQQGLEKLFMSYCLVITQRIIVGILEMSNTQNFGGRARGNL